MRQTPFLGGALAVALVATLWLVVESQKERLFPDHFDVVKPGLLYRSGQLTAEQLTDVVRRFDIQTVINLQHPGPEAWAERDLAEQLRVDYLNLPMPGDGFGREEQFRKILEVVDDPKSVPVLVHCARGVCRTGASVALYRFERDGWVIEDVADELRRHGYRDEWIAGFVYEMVDRQPYREIYGPRDLNIHPQIDPGTDQDIQHGDESRSQRLRDQARVAIEGDPIDVH